MSDTLYEAWDREAELMPKRLDEAYETIKLLGENCDLLGLEITALKSQLTEVKTELAEIKALGREACRAYSPIGGAMKQINALAERVKDEQL